jgi:hypothetical protein
VNYTSGAAARDARPIADALPPPAETGRLGLFQLKRLWARAMLAQQGRPVASSAHDRHLDHLVIHAAGLGLEQVAEFLSGRPSFDAFENWAVATAGSIAPLQIARINAAVTGANRPDAIGHWLAGIEASAPVLTAADLAFWNEHGYVVLHDAVPPEIRDAAAQALWDRLGASPDDPETWYRRRDHGIMVQYFQHAAFDAIRKSARIHKAFAQLWGHADLWVSTDRVGFNPPERAGWEFPGPHLHWDVSVKTPIPFGTSGILYLTDTPPEQGAFTLVPGFQRWGEDWLNSLPAGAAPRAQNLNALGARPIGGRAGDFIIWHQALPHGASPNRGVKPRMVQYVAMYPAKIEEQDEWI